MARPKTGDKPADIRKATVDEVVAVGSTGVSVNKIAARAGLSVGTIYRYHRSKDELLFAVFLEIKRDIHATMMTAAQSHERPADRLKEMWFALVEYGFNAPGDFQLVELMSSETRVQFGGNQELKQIQAEVLAEIQNGVDDGTLVDTNVRMIEMVMASPTMLLARRDALRGVRTHDDEVQIIYELIWGGIARRKN